MLCVKVYSIHYKSHKLVTHVSDNFSLIIMLLLIPIRFITLSKHNHSDTHLLIEANFDAFVDNEIPRYIKLSNISITIQAIMITRT